MIPSILESARRQLRNIRHGRPIVVVSGLPRSGTSVVMQMLHAGGLPVLTDCVRTADIDNPKGYFEYEAVKHLATAADRSWLRDARGKAVKVISYLLRYLPPGNSYDVVFVERDLDEIVASQDRMLARRGAAAGTEPPATRRVLEEHVATVRRQLRANRAMRSMSVSYRTLVTTPAVEAERMQRFLSLPLDVAAMAAVVDHSLYRNRTPQR